VPARCPAPARPCPRGRRHDPGAGRGQERRGSCPAYERYCVRPAGDNPVAGRAARRRRTRTWPRRLRPSWYASIWTRSGPDRGTRERGGALDEIATTSGAGTWSTWRERSRVQRTWAEMTGTPKPASAAGPGHRKQAALPAALPLRRLLDQAADVLFAPSRAGRCPADGEQVLPRAAVRLVIFDEASQIVPPTRSPRSSGRTRCGGRDDTSCPRPASSGSSSTRTRG